MAGIGQYTQLFEGIVTPIRHFCIGRKGLHLNKEEGVDGETCWKRKVQRGEVGTKRWSMVEMLGSKKDERQLEEQHRVKDAVEKTPERRDVLTKGGKSWWESWRCESLCARNRIYHH